MHLKIKKIIEKYLERKMRASESLQNFTELTKDVLNQSLRGRPGRYNIFNFLANKFAENGDCYIANTHAAVETVFNLFLVHLFFKDDSQLWLSKSQQYMLSPFMVEFASMIKDYLNNQNYTMQDFRDMCLKVTVDMQYFIMAEFLLLYNALSNDQKSQDSIRQQLSMFKRFSLHKLPEFACYSKCSDSRLPIKQYLMELVQNCYSKK